MTSTSNSTKRGVGGGGSGGGGAGGPVGIHKIRELQLQTVDLTQQYDVIKEIGSGDYGKVILAGHRQTGAQVALKAIPKITTPIKDFFIEFHYSYFLSPHHSVLDTYDVAFETAEHYFFAQEVAPLGDLWNVVEKTGGMEERDLKTVIRQIVSALEFMHEKELVHRDVRAENILLFQPDFSKVKLTDFGLTRKAGTLVKKRTRSLPTCPPEIWETVHLEGYTVETGSDVWQMAMFVFTALTAKFPWEKADITDPLFTEFVEWQKRKTTRTPKYFKRFSPRLLRMFRRMMDPKPSKRYPVTEVNKYYGDRWLMVRSPRASTVGIAAPVRLLDSGSTTGSAIDGSGQPNLLPSSQKGMVGGGLPNVPKEEMLGELLTNYGLETRVNKDVKERRIHDWIMSSPDRDSP